MENKTEHFLEKKTICHTYSNLVSEMASRMVVDEQKIMPKEGDVFDYEDINSWVSAVDFVDGKTPNIEAIFSSKQGKERFVFDVEKMKPIVDENKKVSKEQLLYSIALTEAKMKVIQDIAEETYPAVAFQIDDYRKEMDKVREEGLEMKRTDSSMSEVMDKLVPRANVKVASLIVISGLILAGCVEINVVETKTATTSENTSTPPIVETTSAEITESPAVVETITSETNEDEVKREIVRNIEEYFAAEGQYSLENFRKNAKLFYGGNEFAKDGDLPLGVISEYYSQFILLGHLYDENKIMHIYLGTVDVDNNRVVLDYNFFKTFDSSLDTNEIWDYPISAFVNDVSSLDHMGNGGERLPLSSLQDLNKYLDEHMSEPISPMMPRIERSKYYDKGIPMRVALFMKLKRIGLFIPTPGLPTELPKSEVAELTRCLWNKDSFEGLSSLQVDCPSIYGMDMVRARK